MLIFPEEDSEAPRMDVTFLRSSQLAMGKAGN